MAKARSLKTIAISVVIGIFLLLGIIWVIASIGTDLRTGSGSFSSVPPAK
jgi:hypothetical protein